MSDDATREPADLQLREQVRACREAMARGLRSEVEQLLAAHPELRAELAGDLEAVPPAAGEPTIQGTVLQPTLTFASGREQPTKGAASLPSANMGATERIFGDYEIVEEIARGGMGVVYKARQRSLNRLVALKTVLKGDFASEAAMYRFRQEAEAAANLDHPNIVPIHEVGEQAGQQYFSMKLIDVPPGRGQKRGPAEAARLLAKVARAVHHAHERGILHRDLKPGNILIDRQGEPHVADFGLAKHLDAATSNAGEHATQTGAIVGTPAYMAPEQAQAEKSLTTAVDIYSLGAVLYAWLTGQPPFRGDDPVTTLMQVVSAEPRKPRSLDGGIDADLETICLKCLAKLPQQRYSTAAALADDLDRYLRGEPILARRASLGERLWRWSRRNPALAAASGLALAALVAVAVVGSSFAVYQSRAAAELREKQAQTDAALQESRLRASSLELDRCIAQCERGDISLGLLGMVQCLAMAPDDAADLHRVIRGNLAGWSRQLPVLAAPPFEHREAVRAVDFSGDGKVMLTAGLDRTARLWDTATGQPVREPWEHPDEVWCAAISADGQTVATGCHDGFARLWDVATCQPRGVPMKHDKRVNSVAFSPDGQRLLTSGEDRKVQLWETATGAPLGPPLLQGSVILRAVLSPDGQSFAISSGNGLKIRNVQTGSETLSLAMPGDILMAAYSPDGQSILLGGRDNAARLWDVASGEPLGPAIKHQFEVTSAAFSPDGGTVLIGCEDATARLWNPVTGIPIGPPMVHPGAVWAVAFAPDGQSVLTACGDYKARLWRLPPADALGKLLRHEGEVRAVAISPDGSLAATSVWRGDRSFRYWSMSTGQPIGKPATQGTYFNTIAFGPDSGLLLAASQDALARVWDVAKGELAGPPLEHAAPVERAIISPDGQWAATATSDDHAHLWNFQTRERIGPALPFSNGLSAMAFSPDSRLLAVGIFSGNVEILEAATGNPFGQPMSLPGGPPRVVCFSADSRLILTGGDGQTARCWHVPSGEPAGPVLRHQGPVMFGAFLPGDKTVLTMGFDRTARIWDVATGRAVGNPMPHPGVLYGGGLTPDGRLALTPGFDGTSRLWDTATCKPWGPPLEQHSSVLSAAISPDGRSVVTGGKDGTARIWSIPEPLADDIQRLRLWISALTGMELAANGAPISLSETDWQARRRQWSDLERTR